MPLWCSFADVLAADAPEIETGLDKPSTVHVETDAFSRNSTAFTCEGAEIVLNLWSARRECGPEILRCPSV